MNIERFERWPLLAAGTALAAAGVTVDLTASAPVAYGLWALASASFGAFLYAEGARMREWHDAQLDPHSGPPQTRTDPDGPPMTGTGVDGPERA